MCSGIHQSIYWMDEGAPLIKLDLLYSELMLGMTAINGRKERNVADGNEVTHWTVQEVNGEDV